MPTDIEAGTQETRARLYDSIVKGVTEKTYKFKQVVLVSPTSAWKNFFYREDPSVLTEPAGNAIRGIPRGANFPVAFASWELIQKNIEKYGLEVNMPWEDIISSDFDLQMRQLIKLGERVAKAVDDQIWIDLGGTIDNVGGNSTATTNATQSFSVTARPWTSSSANIIDDLMRAKQLLGENYYPTSDVKVLMNERAHRAVLKYLVDKGAQFPQIATNAAGGGSVSQLAGFDFIVSNSATASNALVVVPKRCATWKELVSFQTNTTEDPFRSVRIRAVEEGVLQLTDPLAVVRIMGTEGVEN
mgnify:CR=1 FL=1